ncbi:MAG: tautomerase family protein [Sporosarcina sp.]
MFTHLCYCHFLLFTYIPYLRADFHVHPSKSIAIYRPNSNTNLLTFSAKGCYVIKYKYPYENTIGQLKGEKMPIIRIILLEGRDDETIENCMRDVARTLQKSLDIPLKDIRVLVNEVPKNRFSVGDQLKSED